MKHISEILEDLMEDCSFCRGLGYAGANSLDMHREPCPDCGGSGRVPVVCDDPGLPLGWESVEIVEP